VDDIDLGIVRWMYPDGTWVPWGVDPRITPAQIGRRIGLSRTAVWARVRQWAKEGFLETWVAGPNIRLFDAGILAVDLHITDPADATSVLEELELVEGVTYASVGFGDARSSESVEQVSVCFVDDNPTAVARRMRLFRRLSTAGVVDGPYEFRVPTVSRQLSALDWRIIAALRAKPRASLSRVAELLGITLKTLVRRRDALLESKAIWYYAEFDWSRLPSVALRMSYHQAHELPNILRTLDERFRHYLPMSLADIGAYDQQPESQRILEVRVPARSPDEVQHIMIDLARIPGVTRVRNDLYGPARFYHHWVNQRLASRIAELQIGIAPSHRARRTESEAGPETAERWSSRVSPDGSDEPRVPESFDRSLRNARR